MNRDGRRRPPTSHAEAPSRKPRPETRTRAAAPAHTVAGPRSQLLHPPPTPLPGPRAPPSRPSPGPSRAGRTRPAAPRSPPAPPLDPGEGRGGGGLRRAPPRKWSGARKPTARPGSTRRVRPRRRRPAHRRPLAQAPPGTPRPVPRAPGARPASGPALGMCTQAPPGLKPPLGPAPRRRRSRICIPRRPARGQAHAAEQHRRAPLFRQPRLAARPRGRELGSRGGNGWEGCGRDPRHPPGGAVTAGRRPRHDRPDRQVCTAAGVRNGRGLSPPQRGGDGNPRSSGGDRSVLGTQRAHYQGDRGVQIVPHG